MYVYMLIKERYTQWDNDWEASYKVFKDEQSAINYFIIEREALLEDAYHELNVNTVEEIKTLYDNEEEVYCFTYDDDWYHIEIEDWGYDLLKIEKQDVMEFNI